MGAEYLNNKAFEASIFKFRNAKDDEEFKEAQAELVESFYTLAKNIIRAFKFQLVDKDDALQEGVMICFEKLHKFDPNRGKIFSYASSILLNLYKQMYRSAKNYNELKLRYHTHLRDKNDESYLNNMDAKKGRYYKKGLSE